MKWSYFRYPSGWLTAWDVVRLYTCCQPHRDAVIRYVRRLTSCVDLIPTVKSRPLSLATHQTRNSDIWLTMNKDLVQGPLLQQLPPQDSSTDMFSLSSIPRSSSSQSTLCQRPIVISDPTAIPSQSSWDVESLGSPPRKATPDRQRTPKPLPSLPLTGESLRRSNSGASRRAQCTPDLYDGQSEASESLPATPLTPSRSPTPGPSSYATSPFEESKQKATEDPQEDPEIAQERDQFVYERNIIYHHRFPREDVPYMQSYSDVSLWK